MVRGMMALYVEADLKGKDLVVAEFKKVLTLYLETVLFPRGGTERLNRTRAKA
jgi:hypothetical protein